MTAATLLDRLCALYGIDPGYTDVWQKPHAISDDTKRKLLAALQVGTASESEMRHALEAFEARGWQRALPPVLVAEEGAAIEIPLSIEEADAAQALAWRLTLESGAVSAGEFAPVQLPPADHRTLAGRRLIRYRWSLPDTPPLGYHTLQLDAHPDSALRLIIVPATCYLPPALMGAARTWGPALQLYALRSQRNCGCGDFADLRAALEFAAQAGAGMVGVNPLHALFPAQPERASPYSPSSRRFLNVLYLALEDIPEFAECEAARELMLEPGFQARLQAARARDLVPYREVAALKLPVLERLYARFRSAHLQSGDARADAFRVFQVEHGAALRRQALFDALNEHFAQRDPACHGWLDWPAEFHDPHGAAASAFAAVNQERVEFHAYLQWNADLQLSALQRRSAELGMAVGLYLDSAVGVAADGADTWAAPELYVRGAQIGAPPDEYNQSGQDWGLPPLHPQRLRDAAYQPFIDTLRANMRHAGALRLDHVMGLMRLFWVPAGEPATQGGYVRYPLADLFGIVALESRRRHCVVIGEDLGTVPDEVREAMRRYGVFSYRIFHFEQGPDGAYKPPQAYPEQALVAAGTHDLPTLSGFWQGYDLETRSTLGLFPTEDMRQAQVVDRVRQRAQLLVALDRTGLLPAGINLHAVLPPVLDDELALAVQSYLARTPSKLMAVQMEDVFGQLQQVNLPGAGVDYPSWQRKLAHDLECWPRLPALQALAAALRRERGTAARPAPQAAAPLSVPRATYRLQFNHTFTFADATRLIPYLAQLGVSHCYASPYFKARPGSMHGYDIIDHNALNPEIGSAQDFERFVAALHEHGLGQLLDIVPNHMGVMGSDNGWWLDVLENGQCSQYAEYFDIDWAPLQEELRGKLLLPVLGDPYGSVLERGDLKLAFDGGRGEFSLWYFEHRLPLDPRTYPRIAAAGLPHVTALLGADDPQLLALQSLLTAFERLPPHTACDPEQRAERVRDKEFHKRHLAALCAGCPEIAAAIAEAVALLNGEPGRADSFDALHQLIKLQAFRLGHWRVASDEINYRRFFDINGLAGLRVERDEVFVATHRLALGLAAGGKVNGLRIDHPDGLFDPLQYFRRLQHAYAQASGTADAGKNLYVVIEKIIAGYENLPADWPVSGTTGYRFANVVNGLFVDGDNEKRMDRTYAAFIGERLDFSELLYRSKRRIMESALASELTVLANLLSRIAQMNRHTCDFTTNGLRAALLEVAACFPVYRTYVSAEQVADEDVRYIDWAVSSAKKRSQASEVSVFDFVRDALLTRLAEGKSARYREAVTRFAMKFQQFTSPVTAKGMEDTAFYRYHRLVSLNDVGGDPRTFGLTLSAFHGASQSRARSWPHTMLATSTHDNKRSEDVRARINVLSEMPAPWRLRLRRWRRLSRSKKSLVDGVAAPSHNDEYLLYQTLVGAWPPEAGDSAPPEFIERVAGYMLKAVREAKQHSSWINPNPGYEAALGQFVRGLLQSGPRKNPFLTDFVPFQRAVSRFGMLNSLSQTLIKFASPGVPDIYQGNELWDFSLVDPDNRRPVDYARRQALLADLQARFDPGGANAALARSLLDTLEDGRAKLYLTWRALALRARCEVHFRDGEYLPLRADGERADHVCAFLRGSESAVLAVVPRLCYRLLGERMPLPLGREAWGDTALELPGTLAGTHWIDIFTGARLQAGGPAASRLALSELLADFPVALLESREA